MQVEGAFVMGAGIQTLEEVVTDAHGRLVTDGTWWVYHMSQQPFENDLKATTKQQEEMSEASTLTHVRYLQNPVGLSDVCNRAGTTRFQRMPTFLVSST